MEMVEGLDRGKLDIVMTIDYGIGLRADIETMELDYIQNCVVVTEDHRLAGKASASLKDFAGDVFIVAGDESVSPETRFFMNACRNLGIMPQTRQVTDDRTRQLWVESCFGVAMLNVENSICQSPGLKYIKLTDVPNSRLVLAWKKDSRNSSLHLFTHTASCCLSIRKKRPSG